MKIHYITCNFGYATTTETWEVGTILKVFGKTESKLFLVHWKGHSSGEDSGEKEHTLLEDDCAESIKAFWDPTGMNPALRYYPDPYPESGGGQFRCWMCGWKSNKKNKERGLQMHLRLKKHQWTKTRTHTEKKIRRDKLEEQHAKTSHVYWGEDQQVSNDW